MYAILIVTFIAVFTFALMDPFDPRTDPFEATSAFVDPVQARGEELGVNLVRFDAAMQRFIRDVKKQDQRDDMQFAALNGVPYDVANAPAHFQGDFVGGVLEIGIADVRDFVARGLQVQQLADPGATRTERTILSGADATPGAAADPTLNEIQFVPLTLDRYFPPQFLRTAGSNQFRASDMGATDAFRVLLIERAPGTGDIGAMVTYVRPGEVPADVSMASVVGGAQRAAGMSALVGIVDAAGDLTRRGIGQAFTNQVSVVAVARPIDGLPVDPANLAVGSAAKVTCFSGAGDVPFCDGN